MASKSKKEAPFFLVYFGKPHSGKTYDLHQFTKRCGRETIFVYNSGADDDWPGYEEIKLWSDSKKQILNFTYKGKDYVFSESFMQFFKGKRVKAEEAEEYLTEDLLYKQIKIKDAYRGLFFIIDDASSILTDRFTKAQKACFYRSGHVGVWFAIIFHDPASFPNSAWGAVTLSRFFMNNVEPPYEKKRKIPNFQKVVEIFDILQDAPEYTHCTLQMDSGKVTTCYPKLPKQSNTKKTKK